MPCDNIAIQRLTLAPTILQELRESEAARQALLAMVGKLAPGYTFRVSMPETARVHGTGYVREVEWVGVFGLGSDLRVWINRDRMTVSGSDRRMVDVIRAGLEAQLPALAQLFAGIRTRAKIQARYGGTVERVGPNAYRQKIRIPVGRGV